LKLDRPKGNLKVEEHILKEEDLCYRVRNIGLGQQLLMRRLCHGRGLS